MKYLVCPQCGIRRFILKNGPGGQVVIQVTDKLEITPVNENETLDGFDCTTVFCLGCSWKGPVSKLKKYI